MYLCACTCTCTCILSLSFLDVSQLSNLEDEPRDLALSKSEPMIVWSLLLNGTVLGFDPETRERVAKVHTQIHIHLLMLCKKFELIPTKNFGVMAI